MRKYCPWYLKKTQVHLFMLSYLWESSMDTSYLTGYYTCTKFTFNYILLSCFLFFTVTFILWTVPRKFNKFIWWQNWSKLIYISEETLTPSSAWIGDSFIFTMLHTSNFIELLCYIYLKHRYALTFLFLIMEALNRLKTG